MIYIFAGGGKYVVVGNTGNEIYVHPKFKLFLITSLNTDDSITGISTPPPEFLSSLTVVKFELSNEGIWKYLRQVITWSER